MRARLLVRTLLGAALGAGLGLLAWRLWGAGRGGPGQSGAAALAGVLEYAVRPAAQVFLRLFYMLLVPLLFSALALGVAKLAPQRSLAWIAVPAAGAAVLIAAVRSRSGGRTWIDLLVQTVPDNPVKAAANGDWPALAFFALALGVALAAVKSEAAGKLKEALAGLLEIAAWLLQKALALAPCGLFALLFARTAEHGLAAFGRLAGALADAPPALP